MSNTLILTGQIKENRAAGLDDYHAAIEATVQCTRPVLLTALAAVLAFILSRTPSCGHRWPIRQSAERRRHGADPVFSSGALCRVVPGSSQQTTSMRPRLWMSE
ncbi:MAG: hypothetical protein JO211_03670 [Acidobacteriaceae bacterium]|nr:hypothetical protein [Acidobacteriaceae bacterium]